ncbi:MAG: HAD family hydrolase [Candidatus Methylomirabilales bacterium]
MIQAITFDLWDTLIRETPESGRKLKEARTRGLYMLLQGQGYPGTLEEVEAAYEKVGERLQGIWARNVDAGSEEQVQLFLESLDDGWQMPQDRMALANLEWAYVSPALQALPMLNEGVSQILTGLRQQYRLGLICNTGRIPGTMLKIILQRLGILEHFDVLTFSDAVRVRKPDPQIFHLTLEHLEVTPDGALHVGDNPATDIVGARGVGMWAVLLGSSEAPSDDERVRAISALEEFPQILDQLVGERSQAR